MILLWFALGCGPTSAPATPDLEPVPIAQAECAVCGMTVAEQPTPRAQLVYRDGTRAHLCSIGDLRAALLAPSPHGSVLASHVEALPVDFDPDSTGTDPLPWVNAQEAGYVFGSARPQVMGLPVLSFRDEQKAHDAAERLQLEAVGWDVVRSLPFNQAP